MKTKAITLFLFCHLITAAVSAQAGDTIHVAKFGARPYSYDNCVEKIQAAINECKRSGAKVLAFEKGRYDIWPEGAIRREFFVSNTSTEEECPSKVKTIGLLLKDINDLVIDGNGATLMFHGKITTFAFENCRKVRLHNIHVDFERPAASELTYANVLDGEVEVNVHPDTRYEIVNGRVNLFGEGWRLNKDHCTEYNPEREMFTYSQGWRVLSQSEAKEVGLNVIRFKTPKGFRPKVGNTITIRDIIRDQVGMLIHESKDMMLSEVSMHYMGGMGIVSQYTENITMNRVKCMPREKSGRLLASSADMMHFSGCKGKIKVDSCYYSGGQDDPINIHGTNLRAIEKVNDHTLKMRFMHGQSYGLNAYSPNDEVAFVRAATMERFATARVVSAKKLSDRVIGITLDKPVPSELKLNHDCVENLTCTPEVDIRNSYFTRTNARGTLVTTPRKVVIENNTYYKTGMSAILIEGDAEGWFESGPVCDVLIKGNTFVDCGYNGGPGNAVIAINPSNTIVDKNHPVHQNIRIENNVFKTFDYPILFAKSTTGLLFKDNTIMRTNTMQPSSDNRNTFYLNGCKKVVLQNTRYEGDVLGRNIKIQAMKKNDLKTNRKETILN